MSNTMPRERKGGRFKPILKKHLDGEAGIRLRDFTEDGAAIDALKTYLDSDSGIKLRKLLVALEPVRLSATGYEFDGHRLRVLSKIDAENAAQILARAQGWVSIHQLITEILVTQPTTKEPTKRQMIRNYFSEDEEDDIS